jgi:hypothetical protein
VKALKVVAVAMLLLAGGLVLSLPRGGVVDAHPPAILNEAAEKLVSDDVKAFRKAMVDAIALKDAARLKEMYHHGFLHTHTSGKVDGRDARIVSALAGQPVIETAETIEISVRAPNDWVAVVTGMSPIRALSDGKVYAVRWIQVFTRTEKSWVLVASQATRSHEIKQ